MVEKPTKTKPERFSRRWWKKRLAGAGILVLVAYCLLLGAFGLFQKNLVYHPVRIVEETFIRDEIWMDSSRGDRIHATYTPANEGEPTVVFLHGNGGNILYFTDFTSGLKELGVGVLAPDYPGYGKSGGTPREEGFYASAHAAVEYLNRLGVKNGSIVIFGFSIGTGVAVELAASGDFAGLILQAPFASMSSVGQHHFWFVPVSLLLDQEFDSLSRIGKIDCPKLFLLGTEDELVPNGNSMILYEAASEPKDIFKVGGADHNNIQSLGGKDYWNRIDDWLDELSE